MEKELQDSLEPQDAGLTQEAPSYVPRPWWQVAGAWVALVLFLLVVAGFYILLARGGL